MDIAINTMKRWMEQGVKQKRRRKLMDQEMEAKLHAWCLQESLNGKRPVSQYQIRLKALELSNFPHKFKASEGWVFKFMKRYNLQKEVIE